MKTILIAALVSGFSISGLISCNHNGSDQQPLATAPDPAAPADTPPARQDAEPTPGPTAQPAVNPTPIVDSWLLPRPQLRVSRQGQVQSRDLLTAAIEPLDADATIYFDGDAQGITFNFKSSCHSPADTREETTEIQVQNLKEFPLTALLPAAIFLQTNASDTTAFICQLQVTGTNVIGSTHSFSVPAIRLTHVEYLAKQTMVQHIDTPPGIHLPPSRVLAGLAPSARIAPEPNVHQLRDLDLICEHFHNHRTTTPDLSLDGVLGALILGPIETPDPQAGPYDPRASYTVQRCRIVVRAKDLGTGLTSMATTADFNLIYPLATVSQTMVLSSTLDIMSYEKLIANPILTLQITNNAMAPTAFRFQRSEYTTFDIQPIRYTTAHKITYPLPTNMHTVTQFIGQTRQWAQGDDIVFEVGAKSSATVAIRVTEDWQCFVQTIDSPPGLGYEHVGFGYRFTHPISLRQILNWNPNAPDLVGQDSVLISLPSDRTYQDILEGWYPTNLWARENGGSNARPSFAGATVVGPGGCQIGPWRP